MRVSGVIFTLLLARAYGATGSGFFAKMASLVTGGSTSTMSGSDKASSATSQIVNTALNAASSSGNQDVSSAASAATNLVNSPAGSAVTTGVNQAVTTATGTSATTTAKAATTATQYLSLAPDLNACSTSVKGKETAIQTGYDTVLASPKSNQILSAASAFKTALSVAGADTATQSTLYQMLVIYLAEQSSTSAIPTVAEAAAYNTITPSCQKAFGTLTSAVDEGKAAMTLLVGNSTTSCKNYANRGAAGLVNVTLCKSENNFLSGGQWYSNVTGLFTNYGDFVCNITFYINNLENAKLKVPSWLPHSATAYPNGIPTGVAIGLMAQVPIDVTAKDQLPSIDILDNFYLCKAQSVPLQTAAPTQGRSIPPSDASASKEQQMYDDIANSDRKCFLTDSCASLVAPFEKNQCEALRQVFLSSCHTCSKSVLSSAQTECLTTCSADYCMPKAAVKTTSGANSVRASLTIISVAVAFLLAQWV